MKQRIKYKQSDIEFGEALKMLNPLNPIKVVYNKKELYNDYDSKKVLEILEDGSKVYGENTPPEIVIPKRFPELINKRVYDINIKIVNHHHSIIYMYGDKTMKLQYTCPVCGDSRFITSFWKWFFTPHFGARKYMKCKRCRKIRLFHRWDGRKWVDWPTERSN